MWEIITSRTLQDVDDTQGRVSHVCLYVMVIKLVTLAVPAMCAKTRVELIFPSLSLEKKEAKSVPTLTYWKMAGLAEWAGSGPSLSSQQQANVQAVSWFIIILLYIWTLPG